MTSSVDREDFARFLAEYGMTADFVREVSECTADRIPMPDGFDHLQQQESPIQGLGLFSLVQIPEGKTLAPARIAGRRTPAGYRVNHSCDPNAYAKLLPGGRLDLIAARDIAAGDEITIDYRQIGCVNGWQVQPDRREVISTLRERLRRLNIKSQPDQLEKLADSALMRFGYLPSVPDFWDHLTRGGCE